MKLEPITGIDEISVGDVLKHKSDWETTSYLVTEIFLSEDRMRLSYKREDGRVPQDWAELGLFTGAQRMCRIVSEFLPYDPKQQGDTDDDI